MMIPPWPSAVGRATRIEPVESTSPVAIMANGGAGTVSVFFTRSQRIADGVLGVSFISDRP